MNDFTTAFTVNRTPQEAFAAICNVRGWWSEDIRGGTEKPGDIFNYRFKDIHRCTIKVTKSIPGEKVVWHVLDNYFSFTEDRSEWKGTDVVFDISRKGDQTEVRVTHVGLVSPDEGAGHDGAPQRRGIAADGLTGGVETSHDRADLGWRG